MCKAHQDEEAPRPCDALTRAAGYVVAVLLGRRHPAAEEALAELCRLIEERVLARARWAAPRVKTSPLAYEPAPAPVDSEKALESAILRVLSASPHVAGTYTLRQQLKDVMGASCPDIPTMLGALDRMAARGELLHVEDHWILPRRLRAEVGERQRDLRELIAERERVERECQRLEADLRAVASDRDGWRTRAIRAESSRSAAIKLLEAP
jgi:hypothetical protein